MQKEQEVNVVSQIEQVPVELLKEWPGNPRDNDHAVDPLVASFENFGVLIPAVINDDNFVIAGNTRLKAAIKKGLKTYPCVRASHLSADGQKAFNIADNKLASISYWNDDLLKQAAMELQAVGIPLTDLGFSVSETEIIMDGWSGDAGSGGAGSGETSEPAPGKIVIECRADQEETIRRFIEQKLTETDYVVEFK